MRILIATDAWRPQINGVVRSLEMLAKHSKELGGEIDFLTPHEFRNFPMPGYSEISLALAWPSQIRRWLGKGYDHIHIATEGPIGHSLRSICLKEKICFTTSFHTLFPEYIHARCGLPPFIAYSFLKRFHNASAGTMVSTPTLAHNLDARGFRRLLRWSRGVDHQLFSPDKAITLSFPRPIFLYAGRLAIEKNIEAFLTLDLPGSKVVVGDGPAASNLRNKYHNVNFLGSMAPAELARIYASSDVFVFPSQTDTFGMVLLEALSCGLPIAAYPVMGPLDVVGDSNAGILNSDLKSAALEALYVSRDSARNHALSFSWENSARQFMDNIAYAHGASTLKMDADPWLLKQVYLHSENMRVGKNQ